MPGFGGAGLAGLSSVYGGMIGAEGDEATARTKKYAIDMQQAGDIAFGRTLQSLGGAQQQQMPGMQPQGQMPPQMPGMQPQAPPPQGGPGMAGPPPPPQGAPPMPPGMPPQGPGMPQRPPMPQGAPPMGGGGMPPQMPQQPQQPMGGGMPPGGGGMGGQPTLDWRMVIQKVQQANPGAPPQVIAAAVDKFMPLMNQQSQQQWKEVSLQLRQQSLQNQQLLGQQRIGQGEERLQQGQQKIEQGEANLKERQHEFETREARYNAQNAVRNDQGYQRLEQQKMQIAQRAQQTKDRNLLTQWRAIVDAQHKRAMEIIQSSSSFSTMDPKDRKALLAEQEKAYNDAIEQIRSVYGQSTPSGGTSPKGDKTNEAAPKGLAIPGAPKAGDVIDGYKFKGGEPGDKANWQKVSMSDAQPTSFQAGRKYAMMNDSNTPEGENPMTTEMSKITGGGPGRAPAVEYPQHLEDALSAYVQGRMNAKQVQDTFRKSGWRINLRYRSHSDFQAHDPSGKEHYIQP